MSSNFAGRDACYNDISMLSRPGTPLDEWQTVERTDWEEAPHADMPQLISSHVKAESVHLKAQTEE